MARQASTKVSLLSPSNPFSQAKWLAEHARVVSAHAGPRYTPELDVEVDASLAFDGLAVDAVFEERFWAYVAQADKWARSALSFGLPELAAADAAGIAESLEKLGEARAGFSGDCLAGVDTSGLLDVVRDYLERTEVCLAASRRAKDEAGARSSDGSEDQRGWSPDYLEHQLSQLSGVLWELSDWLQGNECAAATTSLLLVTGEAGTGKTHVFADVVCRHAEQGLPCLMGFGDEFTSGDPLTQLARRHGLPFSTGTQLLAALDEAGREKGVRALLLIDALNEGPLRQSWRRHIARLVSRLREHDHIGLAVSVRSGFEASVLTPAQRAAFARVEHTGFRGRQWDAMVRYFAHYGVPLPRVPPLAAEFDNPLFLKIFCVAFGGTGRTYTGHEGSTHVFEKYVRRFDREIRRKLGLPGHRRSFWSSVVKPMAAWMGRAGRDEVPCSVMMQLADRASSGRGAELLAAMEEASLLTRAPRYNRLGRVHRYVYRFPYQKFSDHLVVRYLLNAHLDRADPQRSFGSGTPLGAIVLGSWNVGLIEALAIQVPERLAGQELVEVAPDASHRQVMADAFLGSIPWREPAAIGEGAVRYVNQVLAADAGMLDRFLDVVVAVATVPEHPLNAARLHAWLGGHAMPRRDALWSVFLHREYGEQTSVDRTVEWARLVSGEDTVDDESALLCGIVLVWFTATANRFLRDRATKALVALLAPRTHLLLPLLRRFEGVDDPYVVERLYAVAYGSVLRAEHPKGLGELATYVLGGFFADGCPPAHVLLRDYARGIVEFAVHRGDILDADAAPARPPYRSEWPESVPSEQDLKEHYWADEDSPGPCGQIWRSVMGGGDFALYVIGTNSWRHPWSSRRMGEESPTSSADTTSGSRLPHEDRFDLTLAQRWIFARVMQLGWDAQLHGPFDSSLRYRGDSDHKGERIGKKYQWIAYHEFLARVADNFEYAEPRYVEDAPAYEGPWHPNVRDIDPTCLLTGTEERGAGLVGLAFPDYSSWDGAPDVWPATTDDLPDPSVLLTSPDDSGRAWVALEALADWQEPAPPGLATYDVETKSLWYWLKGYVVKRARIDDVMEWALAQDFMGRWMPEGHAFHEPFLREFPWAPAYLHVERGADFRTDWVNEWRHESIPSDVRLPVDECLLEGNTRDCSLDESVTVLLPSRWLYEALDLHATADDGVFDDDRGIAVAWVPPAAPTSALIVARQDCLQAWLDRENLSLFWTLLGEKRLLGGHLGPRPHPAWASITGAYTLDDGAIRGDWSVVVKGRRSQST